MSNAVTTQQTSPSALSTDIHVITAEINAYQRVAGEAIFEIGKRLKHVKENDLAHGEWSDWLNTINMKPRQAQRFLKIYDRFGKTSPVTHLEIGMSVMYELTEFDDEELSQPHEMPDGSTKTLLEMSRREIEEIKRQAKADREAKERAEKAAERALQMTEQERQRAQFEADKRKQAEQQLAVATKPETVVVEREVEKVVTVDKTDYSAVEKLRAYEARFGALEVNLQT